MTKEQCMISQIPDSLLCPWPENYDPAKIYGRALYAHTMGDIFHDNEISSYSIRKSVRQIHLFACKCLPKGTLYEVGIATVDMPNRAIVYFYSCPEIENIPIDSPAMPREKWPNGTGPDGEETYHVIDGKWNIGRFYA